MATLVGNEGRKMNIKTKESFKTLICAAIFALGLAGGVREAKGAIVFDVSRTALPGETITIQLVANAGEKVAGVQLGLLTDNGGAGGTKVGYATPGFWNSDFTAYDPGYNGSDYGYGAGDLLVVAGITCPCRPATGTLYSYTYTVSNLAVEGEVINFTLEDLPVINWTSQVMLWDGSKEVPGDFSVTIFSLTIAPEPCTIVLVGLGSLALLRKRGRREDASITNI